jgi:hypothetical protein
VATPNIDILYFPGCPHHDAARELVERIAAEAGIDTNLRLVEVTSIADAERIRFLGSPTVRMNGHDVEPGADDRDTFTLACRVYRTESGRLSGIPPKNGYEPRFTIPSRPNPTRITQISMRGFTRTDFPSLPHLDLRTHSTINGQACANSSDEPPSLILAQLHSLRQG